MSLRLTFYGGAGKVTGSNFLLEGALGKVLVDCGLEQGADFSAESVYGPFPYDPSTIDALIVTKDKGTHIDRFMTRPAQDALDRAGELDGDLDRAMGEWIESDLAGINL